MNFLNQKSRNMAIRLNYLKTRDNRVYSISCQDLGKMGVVDTQCVRTVALRNMVV